MENKDIKPEIDNDLNADLNLAVLREKFDEIIDLMSAGADINSISIEYLYAPLHSACNINHRDIVELFLEAGADINILNDLGYTPLNGAVFRGHIDLAKFLIEKGADVNLAGDEGYLPLHSAAWTGNLELVKLLLKHGADINARSGPNWRRYTALEAAQHTDVTDDDKHKRHEGADAVVKFLMERLASSNQASEEDADKDFLKK